MSVWLAIGLVLTGFVAVAAIILIFDLTRGDIGGRHTMARARRLLVIASDEATRKRAEEWIAAERIERPDLQCFLLVDEEGESLYQAIHDALDRERPDAIVMARPEADQHQTHTGTLSRLKEEGTGPIDLIYVGEGKLA